MKDVIKKYWKRYLEEVWYMFLIYWFMVYLEYVGADVLILFHPTWILIYLLVAGLNTWIKRNIEYK